jgi:hypothetical protein
LDLVCTLKELDLVMTVTDKVKLSVRRTNARPAMVKRSSRKRRSLRSKLIRVLLTVRNTFSTVKLTSSQV